MKFLLAFIALTVSISTFSDSSYISKKAFKKAISSFFTLSKGKYKPKKGQSKDYFQKRYFSKLEKLSDTQFVLKKTLSRGLYKAYIFADKDYSVNTSCSFKEKLSSCLHNSLDQMAFVVKTPTQDLVSIGFNKLLPYHTNRYGKEGIEHEILIFKGKEQGRLKLKF